VGRAASESPGAIIRAGGIPAAVAHFDRMAAAALRPAPRAPPRPPTPPVSAALAATPASHAGDSMAPVQDSLPADELTTMAAAPSALAVDSSAAPAQHEAQLPEQTVLEAAQALAASGSSRASEPHDLQMDAETEAGACCADSAPAELSGDGTTLGEGFLGSPAASLSNGSPLQATPSCTARQAVEPVTPIAAATAAHSAVTAVEGALSLLNPQTVPVRKMCCETDD